MLNDKGFGSCQILVQAVTDGNPKPLLRIKAKAEAEIHRSNAMKYENFTQTSGVLWTPGFVKRHLRLSK